MIRTQVQLTEQQIKALKRASAATGESLSDLIRQGVDAYLAVRNEPDPEEQIERAIAVAGRFSSGRADVSAHHDEHLAEAFGS